MGGPRVDFDKLRKVISAQPRTFLVEDIAREGQVSVASVYTLVKEMLADGSIVIDHKLGKRKVYSVSSKGSKDGVVKPNISQLPPAKRFEHIGTLVDMVATKVSPSAMITGLSGIGKTFLVRKHLQSNGLKENVDYFTVMGHSSPMGLYQTLYDHRDQVVVFDDCDSVFKDASAVNLLKSALDSYDVRKVSWQSSRMPENYESQFEFEGQIIFVSNLLADQIDEAIKSRTFVVDLQMSRPEICEYLWTLVGTMEPNLDIQAKTEVLKELELRASMFEQFNLRTFIKACRIYSVCQRTNRNWKEMLTVMM